MRESVLRPIELGVALATTYMAAVTVLQTTLYAMIVGIINERVGPVLGEFAVYLEHFDILVLVLVLVLCFQFWRRGDEVGFGRLFSLNMLMFFPAVLDFSTFNWVGLILDYVPEPGVSGLWVFGVGLLLQATYLFLRYTLRFRYVRAELAGRGAEPGDLEAITRGQFNYLLILVAATVSISAGIYIAVPYLGKAIREQVLSIPSPQLFIGLFTTILLAGATILYLRGSITQTAEEAENASL